MCRPTRCRSCGRTTWAGCGQHVDQVMARVPRDQQCTCDADGGSTDERSASGRSLLDRLRGR